MAKTESLMMPLGAIAPDFKLPDSVSGKELELAQVMGEKGTVIMFICNHCPYVIHVQEEIVRISKEYQEKGLGFVAISSNDVDNYPQDAPDLMAKHASGYGFGFPYLYDESQIVAKTYQAACTPDFYVFNAENICVYRGRMGEATLGNDIPVNGKDLRKALTSLLQGTPVDAEQFPSLGCGIKWK